MNGSHARLVKLVGLDQGDACRVVFAAHDSCVSTRSKLAKDRGFARIGRRNSGCLNGSRLGVLPIIVSSYDAALAVVKLKRWIVQWVRHANAWTEGAKENGRRSTTDYDRSANQDSVALIHKSTRGDVCQPRVNGQVEIIDFYQANTGCSAFTGKHRGVSAGIYAPHDGRVIVVGRRNCCRY